MLSFKEHVCMMLQHRWRQSFLTVHPSSSSGYLHFSESQTDLKFWPGPFSRAAHLQVVLVHVLLAPAVQVQHPDAAAHRQEVAAAVQRRQVHQDRPEAALHLTDTDISEKEPRRLPETSTPPAPAAWLRVGTFGGMAFSR